MEYGIEDVDRLKTALAKTREELKDMTQQFKDASKKCRELTSKFYKINAIIDEIY